MTATKGHAIALAVVAGLILASGITVMVLFKYFFDAILELNSTGNNAPHGVINVFWPYGIPVLICGVLGIVAAAVRNNVAVGFFMAVCIISLVIEGGLFVIAVLLFFALSILTPNCYGVQGIAFYSSSGVNCDTYDDVIGFGRGCMALIIIAWLLILAGSIISCVACCCGERRETSSGMVLQDRTQTTVFTSNQPYHGQAPVFTSNQPYHGQGGYDASTAYKA